MSDRRCFVLYELVLVAVVAYHAVQIRTLRLDVEATADALAASRHLLGEASLTLMEAHALLCTRVDRLEARRGPVPSPEPTRPAWWLAATGTTTGGEGGGR